jgi:hypothetical protein
MKPDPLLDAVFGPGEESLRPALAAARRRRIIRKIIPAAIVAAGIAVAAGILVPRTPPALQAPLRKSTIETIVNRALAPGELVHTSSASVVIVSTSETAEPLTDVTDSELLSQFAPGRAALAGNTSERRLVQF